jgi:hypothetical protein
MAGSKPGHDKQRVIRALVTFEELADFPHYDGVMVSFTAATNWLSVKGLGRNANC